MFRIHFHTSDRPKVPDFFLACACRPLRSNKPFSTSETFGGLVERFDRRHGYLPLGNLELKVSSGPGRRRMTLTVPIAASPRIIGTTVWAR